MSRMFQGSTLLVLLGLLFVLVVPAPSGAAPVVMFDQSHDQRFVIEKEGSLDLSGLATVFRDAGYTVTAGREQLTDISLDGTDVLILSGPFKPLEKSEVEAVLRFLDRGGRLAMMLHVGSPFADLLHSMEVDFTNYVLFEQENIIDGDKRNFRVVDFDADPLFRGLSRFSLYGGWALMNTDGNSRIVARTSAKGWIDMDGDQKLTGKDVVDSFGVVVTGMKGSGRFVVFGDDAIFQNRFLDEQNRLLADNLAQWLK